MWQIALTLIGGFAIPAVWLFLITTSQRDPADLPDPGSDAGRGLDN